MKIVNQRYAILENVLPVALFNVIKFYFITYCVTDIGVKSGISHPCSISRQVCYVHLLH